MVDYEARTEERIDKAVEEAILSLAKNGVNNYCKYNKTGYKESIIYISSLLNLDEHMVDTLMKEYNV